MKKISKLRGMQDTDPIETTKINFVENSFNQISKSYGYQEVRFPIIESTDLFKRSVGDQSDIVNKEMFTFESKSGKSMTLRPEGTAGCMRMAIETGLVDAGQQRLSYKGPMFRYERPQKGRSRQFQQLSLEAYGFNDYAIDLEMLEISNFLFEELSVKEEMTLEINSIGSQKDQKEYSQKLKDYFSKYKNDLDEDSLKRLEKNPLRILDSKNQDLENLIKEAPKIDQSISNESQEKFSLIKNYLDDLEIQFKENPLLVRGLDYYNDLVFEWKSNSIGSQDTICGGGRYDSLSKIIGGRETSAIGLSIGLERLCLLIEDSLAKDTKSLLIVALEDSFFLDGMKLASSLRKKLKNFSIQFSGKEKNLKALLKKANKKNTDFMVIIGREEIKNNSYTLKKLSMNQEIKIDNFDSLLKNLK
ncbi:MAG: histidine--tRNA ligase [SAR86 cluster bacterium]|uniref:Histidine--tRNA ligase n=1 Tax=SAR86 cluster bacterium TaxID=2030880 RepID=A0A937HZX6_9GAMM|nr:histidine--tRNA ligase [SAR86 cluster bacterium]